MVGWLDVWLFDGHDDDDDHDAHIGLFSLPIILSQTGTSRMFMPRLGTYTVPGVGEGFV